MKYLFLPIYEEQSPLAFTLVPVSSTPFEEVDIALNVLSKDVHLPACAVRTVLVSQLRMMSSMEVELGLMLGVAFILNFRFTFLELMCDAQSVALLEQLVASLPVGLHG